MISRINKISEVLVLYVAFGLFIGWPLIKLYQCYKYEQEFDAFDNSKYKVIASRISDFEQEKRYCGKQRCDNYYARVDFKYKNEPYVIQAAIHKIDYDNKGFLSQHPQSLLLYYSQVEGYIVTQHELDAWRNEANSKYSATTIVTMFLIILIGLVLLSNFYNLKKSK